MPSSRRRLIIFGFSTLVTLVVVMAIERGLSNLYWNYPETRSFERRVKQVKAIAALSSEKYDVLFLGDSTALEGVVPLVFQQLTGRNGYNLATYGLISSVADVYLVDAYLRHHPAPQAIFVVRTLGALDVPREDAAQEHFDSPALALFRYRNGFITLERAAAGILAGLLPSFANRYQIHDILFGQDLQPWMFLHRPQVTADSDRGYVRLDTALNPSEIPKVLAQFQQRDKRYLDHIQQSLALIGHLCTLGASHNIPVIVAADPLIEPLTHDATFKQTMEQIQQLVSSRLHQHAGCFWHPAEAFDTSLFADLGGHLNGTGAVTFTGRLATYFANDLHLSTSTGTVHYLP